METARHQQQGNRDQQQAHHGAEDFVNAGTRERAQMGDGGCSQNAAQGERHHHSAPHRASAPVEQAAGNLGQEVEERKPSAAPGDDTTS